jgi:hypothetical protein
MTRPSWQDFGTFDESAHPRLWDGVIGAWCPFLGATGLRQHDLSRSISWQSSSSLPTYAMRDGMLAIVGNAAITGATPSSYLGLTQATLLALANKTAQGDTVSFAGLRGPNNSRFGATWFSDGNLYALFEAQGATDFNTRVLTGAGTRLIGLQYAAPTVGNQRATWVDGVKLSELVAPSSLATSQTTHGLAGDGQNLTSANGGIFGMMFWNRCLSDNELREIYSLGMPALFERKRRTIRRMTPEQAGFRPYWALQRNQTIGGGLR